MRCTRSCARSACGCAGRVNAVDLDASAAQLHIDRVAVRDGAQAFGKAAVAAHKIAVGELAHLNGCAININGFGAHLHLVPLVGRV